MKAAFVLALFIGCAQTGTPAPAKEPRGACAYSWSMGGTWITWCYQEDTKTTCEARDNSTGFSVYFQDTTCPAAGYPLRCASGAYKNTTCQWYE